MAATGTVRAWDAEAGWGVIDSAATPGGCWASWTVLPGAGWRHLVPGQTVTFEAEPADQDGLRFRAIRIWNVEVHGATAPSRGVSTPVAEPTESTSRAWDIGPDGAIAEIE